MNNDRNKFRVSLRFNDSSESHQKALALLKQLGRKKSEFVTKCILEYVDNQEEFDLSELQKELGTGGYYSVDRKPDKEFEKEDAKSTEKPQNNQVSKGEKGEKSKKKFKQDHTQKSKPKPEPEKEEELTIEEDEIPEIPSFGDLESIEKKKEEPTEVRDKVEKSKKTSSEKEKSDSNVELSEEDKKDLMDSLEMFGNL